MNCKRKSTKLTTNVSYSLSLEVIKWRISSVVLMRLCKCPSNLPFTAHTDIFLRTMNLQPHAFIVTEERYSIFHFLFCWFVRYFLDFLILFGRKPFECLQWRAFVSWKRLVNVRDFFLSFFILCFFSYMMFRFSICRDCLDILTFEYKSFS